MDGLLTGILDERGASMMQAIVVVGIALLLLAGILWLLRARERGRTLSGGQRAHRLAVLDSAAVDARRRLVLVRRDNVEHLLLIGGPADVVVESGIEPRQAPPSGATGLLAPDTPAPEPARRAPMRPVPARSLAASEEASAHFAPERFTESPGKEEADPEAGTVGIQGGNPFDESDFGAVLDSEMEKRHAAPGNEARDEPRLSLQSRPHMADGKESLLEDEMARLLADMSRNKR